MAANCWGESYGIDAWGNLNSIASLSSAYTGCAQEPGFSTTASARNQLPLTGNAYDSAGNVITAPVGGITNSYSYNADNQMLSMTGLTTTTNYVYDGDGKRVQKTGSKLYWYGADGAVLDETDATGSVTNANFSEYIFVGGKRMARRDSAGNVLYYFADHLGTSRTMAQVASGQTTATLCYDADFYPFGGERTVVNLCGQNYKFTGKERDQESGLDEFGARYYASAFGRFTIPDWAEKPTDVPYANFGNPQSLNLYSYVQNNPTTLGDPDGHQCSQFNQSDPCQPPPKPPAQKTGRQPDGSYVADLKSKEIAPLLDPNHKPSNSDIVGNGQCVTACSKFSGVTGATRRWTEGPAAAGDGDIKPGTAIATFGSNRRYPTGQDKNSGIYLGKGSNGGIWILDQWPAHPDLNTPARPPQPREMRLNDGRTLSNSANAYHVILVAPE